MYSFNNINDKEYKLFLENTTNILIFKIFENLLKENKEKIDNINKHKWNISKKKQKYL